MSREEFGEQASSGGIKDFEFTVTNAFWAIDEKYSAAAGADTYFLHWEGITDVEGHEQMARDGFHPKWAADADWLSMDGGKSVKSQSGKDKLGKAVGRMMLAAFEATAEYGAVEGHPEDPFTKGTSKEAHVWVGSKWFITEVITEWGNGLKSTDLLPTKYLGLADVAAAPVAAAEMAAAPVGAAGVAANNGDLRTQVTTLAGTLADHASFVAAAMAIPGVAADATLVSEIVSPTGLHAVAQG